MCKGACAALAAVSKLGKLVAGLTQLAMGGEARLQPLKLHQCGAEVLGQCELGRFELGRFELGQCELGGFELGRFELGQCELAEGCGVLRAAHLKEAWQRRVAYG